MKSYKALGRILLLLVMVLVPLTSALDADNWMNYDSQTEEIIVTNWLNIGSDLVKAKLNSNMCEDGRYCEATKTITLYTDEPLVQNFKTIRLDDGSNSEQDIRWWRIEYLGDIDDYEYRCYDTEEVSINGTVIQECSNELVGSHEGWINYNLGDILPAGTYDVRTTGEIRPGRLYDWQIKIAGKWTTPWAIWGNISLGAEAEVILNSPANGAIAYVNNQMFNASANITLAAGATLVNMSLFDNSTGSWAERNSTDLVENLTSIVDDNYKSISSGNSNDGGIKILVGYAPLILYNVTKPSSTATTTVTLKDSSYNDIANATYSGNNAVFSTPQILSANTAYYIVSRVPTVNEFSRDGVNGATVNFPISKTYYSITAGRSPFGSGDDNDEYGDIRYIGIAVTPTSSTQTWNRTIDEGIIWNVQACDSDGDCGFSTSNFSLSIDTTAPSIDILYPSGTLSTLVDGQNVSLNYTITDTNIDTCWYSYNGTNVTTPCVLNSSFLYNFGENSITLWANDSVGNVGSDTQSWGVGILENSQTFNNETVEGSIENFYANVTLDPSLEITQADLIYNGTTVSGTFLSDGQIRLLSVENYEIPSFVSDSNATFYWSLTLTSGVIVNLSTQTQFVGVIGLDNCSTYTNQLFNISLFDERAKTPINGTIELYYQVQNVPTYTTIKNLTGKFENVHNTLVCSDLNLTAQNLAYSAEIRYTSNEYAPELYHIQRAVISPETVNVNLYDLNSSASTEFKITYQDDTFNFVEGAILQLRRRYISEDAYEVVEAPLTSNEGIAVLHIDLDSVKYAATVTKNGVVLDTFNNLVFKCQSILTGECEQKLLGNIDPQNTIDYDTERDFAYTVTPGDNNVTISYTIPSSAPSSVNMVLTQKDQFGNTTQCNKTVVSSGGSIQCTYDDTLDVSYLELVITKDGVPMSFNTYVSDASTGSAFFDNNYIIVVVLMLSLVGMALSSPEWIMLNGIMTLLLSGMLWLVNGVDFVAGLGILMWLVIAAGIIILKLSKQEDR